MTTIEQLLKDLEQSYVRTHQMIHTELDREGEAIDFKDCSLWICKNAREKLAEWIEVVAGKGWYEYKGEKPRQSDDD